MIDQATVKTTNAAKRLRSANAPLMRAGVMAANIIWNVANRTGGMVSPSPGSMPITAATTSMRPGGRGCD